MVAAPPLNRITVEDAVTRYVKMVNRQVKGKSLSEVTASNYLRDLSDFVAITRRVLGVADNVPVILDDLTAENIDDIVLEYGDQPDGRFTRTTPGQPVKKRGEGAMARFRQSVSKFFTEATLEGWVEANPVLRAKVKPKSRGVTNMARKSLSMQAAQTIVEVEATARRNGTQDRPDMQLRLRDEFLLRLLIEVGPRVSEVSRADRSDLYVRDTGEPDPSQPGQTRKEHWLRLLGKGNKPREVPLSDGTVAVYREYLAHERPQPRPRTRRDPGTGETYEVDPVEDADRALLLTWRGLRMKPRDIQLMVERASKRLPGGTRVTPHGLRHTAATLLLASGAADVKTVKDLLGHASLATTGIYLDTISHELVNAVRMHPVTGEHVNDRRVTRRGN